MNKYLSGIGEVCLLINFVLMSDFLTNPIFGGCGGNSLTMVPLFISDQCLAFEISDFNSKVYVAAVYVNTSYLVLGYSSYLGGFNYVTGSLCRPLVIRR
jgi:hypothetical protein